MHLPKERWQVKEMAQVNGKRKDTPSTPHHRGIGNQSDQNSGRQICRTYSQDQRELT